MSKLGKKQIFIHKDSNVKINLGKIILTGPKGSQEINIDDKTFTANVSKDNFLSIKPKKTTGSDKRIWGMTRSMINNALHGVTYGYEKILRPKNLSKANSKHHDELASVMMRGAPSLLSRSRLTDGLTPSCSD